MKTISLVVNGQSVEKAVSDRTHLGDFLREQVGLTGTHLGCEHGICGACTVLSNGQPIRSCITFAVSCEGQTITTVEGYGDDPIMRRLRDAFTEHHALQCGYCTPGMLATARDIVLRLPEADEQRIRIELAGNICRCTGYVGIVAAILAVQKELENIPDPLIETLRAAERTKRFNANLQLPSGQFANFQVHADPVATDKASTSQQAVSNADTHSGHQKNQTHIDGFFDLAFDAKTVWCLMTDLPAVAACLPGAEIKEQVGNKVHGRVGIKFGPMSASFNGVAVLEKDEQNFHAVLKGSGQDSLSQSRATGDVQYRLEVLGQAQTRVHVDLAYSLQGPLAQFSRSGLVQEFVRRMISDFGKNVAAKLTNPALAASLPAAPIHPVKIVFALLWARVKRWFS